MNINLDNRLFACAAMIENGTAAADIGTDHGLLPAYLVLNGKCRSAFACDINQKPLESAKETIKKFALEDKIRPVLTDGLNGISLDELSHIIIAGMGGELIADILADSIEKIKQNRNITFVLQPMSKPQALRQYLYQNGFEIVKESVARDKYIYCIMQAVYTGECLNVGEDFMYYGKIPTDEELGREYLENLSHKLKKASDGCIKSDTDKGLKLLEISKSILNKLK